MPNITETPTTDCSNRISWFVNEELVEGPYLYNELADVPSFYYTFEKEGKYEILVKVCNCCGCCEYKEVICVGSSVSIERSSCYKFKLIDNVVYSLGLDLEVSVYNTKQEKLTSYVFENYTGEKSLDISLPQDGIYIVEYSIYNKNLPTNIIERKRFVIYEFCSLLSCYKELLLGINCTNCDPCNYTKEEDRLWLDQLNMFMANVLPFIQNLALHYGLENNHFLFKEEYISFIDNSQDILDNLLRICGKCGYIERNNPIPYKCVKITPCGCGKV